MLVNPGSERINAHDLLLITALYFSFASNTSYCGTP